MNRLRCGRWHFDAERFALVVDDEFRLPAPIRSPHRRDLTEHLFSDAKIALEFPIRTSRKLSLNFLCADQSLAGQKRRHRAAEGVGNAGIVGHKPPCLTGQIEGTLEMIASENFTSRAVLLSLPLFWLPFSLRWSAIAWTRQRTLGKVNPSPKMSRQPLVPNCMSISKPPFLFQKAL